MRIVLPLLLVAAFALPLAPAGGNAAAGHTCVGDVDYDCYHPHGAYIVYYCVKFVRALGYYDFQVGGGLHYDPCIHSWYSDYGFPY